MTGLETDLEEVEGESERGAECCVLERCPGCSDPGGGLLVSVHQAVSGGQAWTQFRLSDHLKRPKFPHFST